MDAASKFPGLRHILQAISDRFRDEDGSRIRCGNPSFRGRIYFGRPFGERIPESVRDFGPRHLTSEPIKQEWEIVRTAMPFYFFVWTPEIIAHLAEHDVTIDDVGE